MCERATSRTEEFFESQCVRVVVAQAGPTRYSLSREMLMHGGLIASVPCVTVAPDSVCTVVCLMRQIDLLVVAMSVPLKL
jgi:hypothetical protein